MGTENVVLRIDEDPIDWRNLTAPVANRGFPEFRRTGRYLIVRQAKLRHNMEHARLNRQDSPTAYCVDNALLDLADYVGTQRFPQSTRT